MFHLNVKNAVKYEETNYGKKILKSRSIAENMIPFKDGNGVVYVPAGRGDALSLVLTELVILKPSSFTSI
ncbi:hypothetical protein T03_8842 [Trichinella britovi]|uniref:Uncharacterized protein n=1 Tax=Trichinella britovi TaxID=45882 RepID=A0A0V1D5N9_TRIBR|nr:hypothetical protein T03_8842 [Trichinella britovi]